MRAYLGLLKDSGRIRNLAAFPLPARRELLVWEPICRGSSRKPIIRASRIRLTGRLTEAMMAAVSLSDIRKFLDGERAVSEAIIDEFHDARATRWRTASQLLSKLNLKVPLGETLVLLGRSGAGKTTALKLINRLLEPSAGQVLVEGRSTTERNPIALRRRTGYVIQETGLFPHYTVEENVSLVPRLEGWPVERQRARVEELLALVGLDAAQF